ncbi:MAG TPA: FAD-binding protein [Nautiliaceae bacterium]|nr:FAD-binding protein [Nautiliaceae bacterium]
MFEFSIKKFEELPKDWDTIIIGGGIAALTAAIYSSRYGLKTLVIAEEPGGLANEAPIVENYPGIIAEGKELAKKWVEHTEKMGAKIYQSRVIDLKKENDIFLVKTLDGKEFRGKTLIYATGSSKRKLNVPGEKEFSGKGISYCATCDGNFFKDKVVAVIGGGNSGFSDALILSEIAKKVYIIHRREKPKAEKALVDLVLSKDNVEFLGNRETLEFIGDNKLRKIKMKNKNNNKIEELEVDGVFIAIGLIPNVDLAKKIGVKLDEKGFIDVKKDQSTNIEGFFAAGDVTNNSNYFEQFVTAAAEGSIAANSAFKYIKNKFSNK